MRTKLPTKCYGCSNKIDLKKGYKLVVIYGIEKGSVDIEKALIMCDNCISTFEEYKENANKNK